MVHNDIFVGLDIGSTKICVIVARRNPTGTIDVIGKGEAPSNGLRKGVVVNIDSTVESIKEQLKLPSVWQVLKSEVYVWVSLVGI